MAIDRTSAQKIPDVQALELCRPIELGAEARALLKPDLGVRDYVKSLLEREQRVDAMAVIAHWLPKREAVWWGCQCIRKAASAAELADFRAPLAAAERWVNDQSDANRRAAGDAASAQDYKTPAALVAVGAFFSEGSLAPADVKAAVPPGPHLTARTVSSGVILAGVTSEPEKAPEKYRAFVELAWSVGDGVSRWTA